MIYGINANSFIDYPGEISFVIFTGGCNFNCPYCHNSDIVNKNTKIYSEEEILNMLKERQKFIAAVTITGGEPTIYGEQLINLIKKIKNAGYKIKLDTNGSNASLLKKIIDSNLVNYIAMDIKNTFAKYQITAGKKINIDEIKKSINLIENSKIEYEFRTTINKTMHTENDIKEIISYIKDINKYTLQPYRYSKQQIVDTDFEAWTETEIEDIMNKLKVSV
ncbi:MAG: anaerobic ribonucleoside-triphosphate reductase activating protein [Bacilli bacterium]|jgi:pyruvate formate lyase activating enzyme|nr:anaerobic ribonucleoside-triphosphate reductase activating protein [Bacilli bacterium]